MTEILLIFGGIIALGFMLIFSLKPSLALLIFYASLPLISYASIYIFRIPGTTATIAIGGIAAIFVLLVGFLYILFTNLKSSVFRWPGSVGFICFLIISGLSVTRSFDTVEGLKYWIRIASLFVLYLLVVNILNTKKDSSRFTVALFIGLAIPLAAGFYQFITGTGMQDVRGFAQIPFGPYRIFGTFNIPNVYAAYLALPAFLSTTLALDRGQSQPKRLFYALLAVAIAISLFLTYTRAAWLGIFLGFFYIGINKYNRILVILIVAVAIVLMIFSAEQLRIGEIEKKKVTFSGRLELWKMMLPVAMKEPILGHGLSNTPQLVKKTTGTINGGQSEYFKALLESGFPGLISLLFIFIPMLKSLARSLKSCRGDPSCEPLVLSIMAYFIATIFIAGFENFTLLENYFLIPVGVGIGIGHTVLNTNPILEKNIIETY